MSTPSNTSFGSWLISELVKKAVEKTEAEQAKKKGKKKARIAKKRVA